jgi:hypothetical protein
MGVSGAKRALHLARNLPAYGWEPVVLAGPPIDERPDPDLAECIPRDIEVSYGFSGLLRPWLRQRREGRTAAGKAGRSATSATAAAAAAATAAAAAATAAAAAAANATSTIWQPLVDKLLHSPGSPTATSRFSPRSIATSSTCPRACAPRGGSFASIGPK